MAVRYSDMDMIRSGARDFVIRKRKPTLSQLCGVFFAAFVLAVLVVSISPDKVTFLLLTFSLLGFLAWYTITQIQKSQDLVLTTEFQNALFASALGLNNKFCIIIKRDGNIIYIDRSFQALFPDFLKQPRRAIDVLLEHGRVPQAEIDKVFSSVEKGIYDKTILHIRSSDGEVHRVILTIEPIMRPSGFIIMRGREFVEKRGGDMFSQESTSLSRSSITLFSHVMDSMKMGVYMTSPTGDFVYANPTLEQWLGYGDGEVVSSNLTLKDIVYQSANVAAPSDPQDYEGEIVLQKKIGGLVKVFINQKIIRDEQGKAIGCTAVMHPTNEASDELKKKLW